MSEKITIGEKEYELPTKVSKYGTVFDANDEYICNSGDTATAQSIAAALNSYADGWREIVTEGLPEEKGFYFVAFHNEGEIHSAPMWFTPKQNKFLLIYPGVSFEDACFDSIIAWSPMPTPFVKEKTNDD
jgi:hypothetical protein